MKYCPQCGGEFFDSVHACTDCNRELVSQQQWNQLIAERRTEDHEVFVKVYTADDQFEADVIKDALEKEAVPVLIRSFSDTSFNGIFIPQKGWGIVLVPEQFRDKAKEVIHAVAARVHEAPRGSEDEE